MIVDIGNGFCGTSMSSRETRKVREAEETICQVSSRKLPTKRTFSVKKRNSKDCQILFSFNDLDGFWQVQERGDGGEKMETQTLISRN